MRNSIRIFKVAYLNFTVGTKRYPNFTKSGCSRNRGIIVSFFQTALPNLCRFAMADSLWFIQSFLFNVRFSYKLRVLMHPWLCSFSRSAPSCFLHMHSCLVTFSLSHSQSCMCNMVVMSSALLHDNNYIIIKNLETPER